MLSSKPQKQQPSVRKAQPRKRKNNKNKRAIQAAKKDVDDYTKDVRRTRNDAPKAGVERMVMSETDRSITARADLSGGDGIPSPLQSLAMGIVLTSLSRGWASNLPLSDRDFPYNAYAYLVQAFISAAQGTTSTLTVAPAWYWYILDAIAPTTVKFKTGAVDYSWSFPDSASYVPPPQVFQFPVSLLGYTDATGPNYNGFFLVTPGTYDPIVADKAIQSLFTLYSENGPMLKRIKRRPTFLEMDVSAFATSYAEMGGSQSSPGGLATSLQNEVFIDCPILAKFAYYNIDKFRGVTATARSAGTPCYIIPRMLEFKSEFILRNKVPPVFKFYNFDEFYECLALTLARAMDISATNNAQQPVLSCPLSPLAMQIVLRQSILPRFCNHMAADLKLEGYEYVALRLMSVASNGVSVSLGSTPLKLPQLLAENIRACDRKTTVLANNDHQADIIPLLCRAETPQLGNYLTSAGVPVFTDVPGETSVDLVSLAVSTNTGLAYLDANGGYIIGLANKFNEWITTLGSSLSPLTNHAEEDGIRALSTIVNTLHCTKNTVVQVSPPDATSKAMTRKVSVKEFGKKIDVSRRVGASVSPVDPNTWTQQYGVSAFTSTYAPLTPIYKYLKVMILPTVMLYGSNIAGNIDVQQVNQIEPFRINFSTTSDDYTSDAQTTLYERHMAFAEQEVRTNLAPATEFQTELDQLTKSGRGGFFTDIAGMIAGDLLHIPGAKQIASTIGQITGL